MHAIVHSADIQDRDGGALLMASLFGAFPFLVKLYADGGYQGPEFQRAMKRILARVDLEIVKRLGHAKGFVVLPKRWIVERTLAWLGRCRRLAKDWECLNRKALAFLRLASIRLMLRKLCNPLRKRSESRYDVFGAGYLNVLLPTAGEFARIADLRKAGRPAPRASLAERPYLRSSGQENHEASNAITTKGTLTIAGIRQNRTKLGTPRNVRPHPSVIVRRRFSIANYVR